MSLSDRTGTSRTFVLTSRAGLDATYVCTNVPSGYTGVSLVFRQTRPSKAGGMVSVNAKCIVSYTDSTTGISYPAEASLTLRFKNDDRATSYQERIQDAATLVTRAILPFNTATIVGTSVETNINNAVIGALPTP